MSHPPPVPTLAPGLYRHYKGKDYEVVGVARHSETLEPVVVYRPRYGEGGLWIRPYAMFCEEVVVDGCSVPRFAPVEPDAVRLPLPGDADGPVEIRGDQ